MEEEGGLNTREGSTRIDVIDGLSEVIAMLGLRILALEKRKLGFVTR